MLIIEYLTRCGADVVSICVDKENWSRIITSLGYSSDVRAWRCVGWCHSDYGGSSVENWPKGRVTFKHQDFHNESFDYYQERKYLVILITNESR